MKGFKIVATVLLLCGIYKSGWGTNPAAVTQTVNLVQFSWKYNTGNIRKVTVCTDTDLSANLRGDLRGDLSANLSANLSGDLSANLSGDLSGDSRVYTLLCRTDGDVTEPNYDNGRLDPENGTCVIFWAVGDHVLPQVHIAYELIVDAGSHNIIRGTAEFAVIRETISMNCGSSFPLYYRIEAGDKAVFKNCLESLDAGDNVCYKDDRKGEALADMNLCYTDGGSQPPNMEICQTGLEVNSALEPGKPLQINYLAYGREITTDATLKLTLDTAEISEVIVVAGTDGKHEPAMCSYNDGKCTIESFEPQNIEHSVCGLATAANSTQFTAVSAIQDFDVFIYAYTDFLLDFGFANAHVERMYSATLLNASDGNAVVDSVNIDCTGVALTHNCYGFLALNGLPPGEVYLEVRFLNTTDEAQTTYNTVIVPYVLKPTTTTAIKTPAKIH